MTTLMSTPGGPDDSAKINVIEWLTDNKLSEVKHIFIKRNIEIEELLEFEPDELRQFGMDIGLDILHINRLIKAINKLKEPKECRLKQQEIYDNNNKNEISMNYAMSSQFVVTTEENEMMLKLYKKYDFVLNGREKIEKESLNELNKNVNICQQEINDEIDKIIFSLKTNKEILLKEIDKIRDEKINKLRVQLKCINDYKMEFEKTKLKYQELLNKSDNIDHDINERKIKIVNIINKTLNEYKNKNKDRDILSLETHPNIFIDFDDKEDILNYLINDVKLNGFDGAHRPIITISKIKAETIKLRWNVITIDLSKDLDFFILEYKRIGDISTLKKKKEEEENKDNDDNKEDGGGFFAKLKKGVSNLFDNDGKNDEEEEAKKYKWMTIKIKIKKKYLNINKWEYKLNDLEANCLYYIRMKIKSKKYGMGKYCDILKIITKDLGLKWNKKLKYKSNEPVFIKSNRVIINGSNESLVATSNVLSMEKNGKKVSWEIKLHQISNPSWIGFINSENINNVNCNIGTQAIHQSIGIYLSNTTITIKNAKRTDNKQCIQSTIYSNKQFVIGDKLIFKANFKKKIVEIQHNEHNLGVVFTNINKMIIPSVSNTTSTAEYTIRLL